MFDVGRGQFLPVRSIFEPFANKKIMSGESLSLSSQNCLEEVLIYYLDYHTFPNKLINAHIFSLPI